MTIHDLNHLLDATYRGSWKSRLYAKPLLRHRCQECGCHYHALRVYKSDAQRTPAHRAARISVIPGCVASCFRRKEKNKARSDVAGRFGITRPYLLFVGNCAPNKNVPLLLNPWLGCTAGETMRLSSSWRE